jgi:hypothetical protein
LSFSSITTKDGAKMSLGGLAGDNFFEENHTPLIVSQL